VVLWFFPHFFPGFIFLQNKTTKNPRLKVVLKDCQQLE